VPNSNDLLYDSSFILAKITHTADFGDIAYDGLELWLRCWRMEITGLPRSLV